MKEIVLLSFADILLISHDLSKHIKLHAIGYMDTFIRTKNKVTRVDSKNSKTLTKNVGSMPRSEKQTF